jgi:hypothetical protein
MRQCGSYGDGIGGRSRSTSTWSACFVATRCARTKLAYGQVSCGRGNDRVFTNERGENLAPDQVRRSLQPALKAAGLARIRPHDLRHTPAGVLLRLRTPIEVVQERPGHSSFAITADIYSHGAPMLHETCRSKLLACLARRCEVARARVGHRIGIETQKGLSARSGRARTNVHVAGAVGPLPVPVTGGENALPKMKSCDRKLGPERRIV